MALQDILERIAEDARIEAEAIVAEATAAAESLAGRAEAEAATAAAASREKAERDAASEAETVVAAARLRARDKMVAARRELVETALRDAEDALVARPDDAYAAYIARGVVDAARGGESVSIAAADRDRLAGRLAAEVERIASAEGRTVDLEYLDEPAEGLERGVLLVGRRVRVEVSPSATLNARRDELAMLAARTLFGGGE